MPTIMSPARSLSIEEEEKPLQGDSSEEEPSTSWTTKPRTLVAVAVGAVLLVSCAFLVTVAGAPRATASTADSAEHITVRQLMEDPELTNLMAQNYVTFRGSQNSTTQVQEARAGVSTNLADFCGYMHARDAGAHDQLNHIRLSPLQKVAVLEALRRYGGIWSQHAVTDIAETVQEVLAAGGDSASLKQRLAEKLRPHLQELQDESHIAHGSDSMNELNLNEMGFGDFDKWHFQFDVSPPKQRLGRTQVVSDQPQDYKLTPSSTEGMTLAQLMVVFGHIDRVLEVPAKPSAPERKLMAPARQLLFEKRKEEMSKGTGKQRFISCLKILLSTKSPKQFCICLTQKCPMLWAWLSDKFLKMTGKPLSIPANRRLL